MYGCDGIGIEEVDFFKFRNEFFRRFSSLNVSLEALDFEITSPFVE